jgi:hypothetical protein
LPLLDWTYLWTIRHAGPAPPGSRPISWPLHPLGGAYPAA